MGALLATLLLGFAMGAGLIFAFAGIGHWRHRRLLGGVVGNYRLLPDGLVAPVAALLPWGEMAMGLALVSAAFSPLSGRAGALAGGGVLLLFGWAMAVNLRRGRGFIDCGCGHAELRQPLSWMLVVRNLVLALPLLAFAALGPDLHDGLALIAAMVAGLAVWLGYNLFNALAALQSSPLSVSMHPIRLPTRR
ncbi:MauE/DoxX family redox-associated membrane protein [Novosphingobium sp. KACC 22771]|uniref:MauE/DoxX family redox-associated membrane protein n=1 Tax=Novosphingobium sp. KACC 22771 TaxID=3025670 RepID=UPI00236587ED|nr:MauE/DoxX family redox-associated membrane protein [Novosphingobium sp. KACC 22771]WDF72039.1 methylamine utilization protein MauE [Novosphingobium sp. KACC 22771]